MKITYSDLTPRYKVGHIISQFNWYSIGEIAFFYNLHQKEIDILAHNIYLVAIFRLYPKGKNPRRGDRI